ncbi:MAG TPA: nicotinate-nucleotide adenylyltransferase [Chiayiivirga sp.]|nr:nicotinate-nucleotide adenylyltransferase [Chiayiivirga sp.]
MLQALYGGAFDPVHLGHLAVARAARDQLDADLALVPTGKPSHRDAACASDRDRIAMLELALIGEPRLHVDRYELDRNEPSYSVDTLAHWRATLGVEAPLALVIGQDAFAGLPTWHRWHELFELAHIVVADRPQAQALPSTLTQQIVGRECKDSHRLHQRPAGCVHYLDLPLHPQSSRSIRARCAEGLPLTHWVPQAVADYIARRGLYREA